MRTKHPESDVSQCHIYDIFDRCSERESSTIEWMREREFSKKIQKVKTFLSCRPHLKKSDLPLNIENVDNRHARTRIDRKRYGSRKSNATIGAERGAE